MNRTVGAPSTIAFAGLIAGVLDITSVFVIYGLKDVPPVRILQSVAAGLLGPQSFQGGLPTAVLGAALHFLIALSAAAVFYAASRKLRVLTEKAVASGLAYGLGVYAFMNGIVLPLSAAKPRYTGFAIVTQLLIHMFLIGLPISLIVRRFSQRPSSSMTET